jgi:cytidylate kinase
MAEVVITIDGPAGSGKSTMARMLAKKLKASFLDTGAMYRAVTLAAMEAGADLQNEDKLLSVLDSREFVFKADAEKMLAFIDGREVSEKIRTPRVTANAKYIASRPKLRDRLVKMQRDFASKQKMIVTEGRDQGTVAFADADVKFFLTADVKERARRRRGELEEKGIREDIAKIESDIRARDKSDEDRKVGPLKAADDAVIVDTTGLSKERVVEKLMEIVEQKYLREK